MVDHESIPPLHWIIFAVAALVAGIAIFHKAIKFLLKLTIIGASLVLVVYFLIQDGVITLPTSGN